MIVKEFCSQQKGTHSGRLNDKNLATFNDFMLKMYRGAAIDEFVFELYDRKKDVNNNNKTAVVKRRYRGAWLLVVDNGYHSWATTVPPIKTTIHKREIRFSSWLESMRIDVEYTFGILKGRFRILKSGIRLAGIKSADKNIL